MTCLFIFTELKLTLLAHQYEMTLLNDISPKIVRILISGINMPMGHLLVPLVLRY